MYIQDSSPKTLFQVISHRINCIPPYAMKNLVIQNKIPMSWPLAIIGIQQAQMAPEDAVALVAPVYWEGLSTDQIAEILCLAEKGMITFVTGILAMLNIPEKNLMAANAIWECLQLDSVLQSTADVNKKLEAISSLWAHLGYPEAWTHFIHYMPLEIGDTSGDQLLAEAKHFVQSQKSMRIVCP